MAYSIQFDNAEPVALATIQGWGELARWLQGIKEKISPHLHHFVQHGWIEGLEDFEAEVGMLLEEYPPKSDDTLHTLQSLLETIQARPEGALVASISDDLG